MDGLLSNRVPSVDPGRSSDESGGLRPRVAVLMTCHNRRETTLACLRALSSQEGVEVRFELFLTDDGCTDATAEAVREVWPGAEIVQGDGTLYWAAGMALAERAAAPTRPDYFLWLNDDTRMDPDALAVMLAVSTANPSSIVVAATRDPVDGTPTYGVRRLTSRWHPQRMEPLPVSPRVQSGDTFNGNLVLIPRAVRVRVGPIDGLFPHAYADDDYGLRATRNEVPVLQAPGTLATCSRGASRPLGELRGLNAWRAAQDPRVLPWRAQVRFFRRHGNVVWPLALAAQQAKILIRGVGR